MTTNSDREALEDEVILLNGEKCPACDDSDTSAVTDSHLNGLGRMNLAGIQKDGYGLLHLHGVVITTEAWLEERYEFIRKEARETALNEARDALLSYFREQSADIVEDLIKQEG